MQDASDLRRGRTCVFELHAHLVFVTKYRREVFSPPHLQRLSAIFADVCDKGGARLLECNGEADLVHLRVNYPPQLALSTLINSLKGVSSRLLRKEFPELAAHTHQGHLWSPSYFAASCGGAPLDGLTRYIEQQRTPLTRP
jgi:putative transposase